MAKQSTVQLPQIVPVGWLVDYVSILREIRQQPSHADQDLSKLDAKIDQRIVEVQAFIDRLKQVQLN